MMRPQIFEMICNDRPFFSPTDVRDGMLSLVIGWQSLKDVSGILPTLLHQGVGDREGNALREAEQSRTLSMWSMPDMSCCKAEGG